MKRVGLLLMVVALLFSFNNIYAQTPDTPIPAPEETYPKHEVNLGVGAISDNQLLGFLNDVIIGVLSIGIVHEDNYSWTATWHAGYKYSLSKRFALSPVFVYDASSNGYVGNEIKGKMSNNYYTLALEADYKFINSNFFKFYSSLGLGGTLHHQSFKNNDTRKTASHTVPYVNFQVTPVGVKFGNTFGLYGELGFGYKGIFNAGVFYKF